MQSKSTKTYLKLTFLFIFFQISFVMGQGKLKNGFIITLNKDTLNGSIEYKTHPKNYKDCLFKGEEDIVRYAPKEITGFGFYEDEDRYFSSQIIEGVFVEALIIGDISLYKTPENFLLTKSGKQYPIDPKDQKIGAYGMEKIKKDTKWKGVIAYLISDCLKDVERFTEKLMPHEKPLTNLVSKYNNCKGNSQIIYKADRKWLETKIGLYLGLSNSDINITDKPNSFEYLPNILSSIDPTGGISINLSSPRLSRRISFETGLGITLSKYTFSSYDQNKYNTDFYYYYDTYVKLSTISVPISINYSMPFKKYRLQLQIGGNIDSNLENKYSIKKTTISDDIKSTDNISKEIKIIDHFRVGAFVGLELFRDFEKFEGGISLRYKSDESFLFNKQYFAFKYYSYNDRLSITFKLLLK